MCTDTILECLPKNTRGTLTKTFEKQISLSEWQKYDSSWDILLTKNIRKHFIDLIETLKSKKQFSNIISEMVEVYNESHGEDLININPSESDLLEILRHVFIYDIVGLARQDLEINQTAKSATLQLHVEIPMCVAELQSIPQKLRQGYGFAFHLDL